MEKYNFIFFITIKVNTVYLLQFSSFWQSEAKSNLFYQEEFSNQKHFIHSTVNKDGLAVQLGTPRLWDFLTDFKSCFSRIEGHLQELFIMLPEWMNSQLDG